jgi:phage shock protein E
MSERLIIIIILAMAIAFGWFFYNGYKHDKEFEKFDKGKALFIDVRTPTEFQQATIDGALNFPVQQLHLKIDELKKISNNGEKQLVLFCRSGIRSAKGYGQLTKAGLVNLLDGGSVSSLQSRLLNKQ